MLLVSIQNPQTKESKVCVVCPDSISEFLQENVPVGCVALVQDVPVYVRKGYNYEMFCADVASNLYDETVHFKSRWYGRNEEK